MDLLVDARAELFELAVRSGLKVLDTMPEEDRTAICGPRYAHVADVRASRAGTASSEVVLGGRKVAVRRPRVRAGRHEVSLPTFQAMADVDPLNRRVERLRQPTRCAAHLLHQSPGDRTLHTRLREKGMRDCDIPGITRPRVAAETFRDWLYAYRRRSRSPCRRARQR